MTDEESANVVNIQSKKTATKQTLVVTIGSKVCLEYFGGPRAGLRSKFILVDSHNNISHEGFDLLPITSPLGEQVEGEEQGTIVSFKAGNSKIDVEIVEIFG